MRDSTAAILLCMAEETGHTWSLVVTYILSRVTPVLGGVAEESAEGDYGGEAREVDEDVRGDRLHGQRVFEVGQVAETVKGENPQMDLRRQ